MPLNEADTCRRYVVPKLQDAGCDTEPHRINEQVTFTDGRIVVSGRSGRSIRTADGKFNINSGTLKTILVPVPAIEEQEEIAKSLAIIDKKAAIAQSKKANLQDLFHTLLHELMTTKIRVNSLEFNIPKN